MPPQYQDDYFQSGGYYPSPTSYYPPTPGGSVAGMAGTNPYPPATSPYGPGAGGSVTGGTTQQAPATPGAAPFQPQIPGSGVGGLIEAPDPFKERTRGLVRAAALAGVNLGSFTPAAKAISEKAGALINELALSLPNNPGMGDSAANMLEVLAGIIRKGVSGGKIFGGNAAGLEGLAGMASAYNVNPGAGNPAQAFAASLLSDPERAAQLFGQAKYGGMAESFVGPAQRGLLSLIDQFYQGLETGRIPQNTPNTFLDQLLGRILQPGPASIDYNNLTQLPGTAGVDQMLAQRQRAQQATPSTGMANYR